MYKLLKKSTELELISLCLPVQNQMQQMRLIHKQLLLSIFAMDGWLQISNKNGESMSACGGSEWVTDSPSSHDAAWIITSCFLRLKKGISVISIYMWSYSRHARSFWSKLSCKL